MNFNQNENMIKLRELSLKLCNWDSIIEPNLMSAIDEIIVILNLADTDIQHERSTVRKVKYYENTLIKIKNILKNKIIKDVDR